VPFLWASGRFLGIWCRARYCRSARHWRGHDEGQRNRSWICGLAMYAAPLGSWRYDSFYRRDRRGFALGKFLTAQNRGADPGEHEADESRRCRKGSVGLSDGVRSWKDETLHHRVPAPAKSPHLRCVETLGLSHLQAGEGLLASLAPLRVPESWHRGATSFIRATESQLRLSCPTFMRALHRRDAKTPSVDSRQRARFADRRPGGF
jgi:hypothetical protein